MKHLPNMHDELKAHYDFDYDKAKPNRFAARLSKEHIYRKLLKELLSQHASRMNRRPQPNTETEVTFDEERDHYMLLRVGWTPKGRVFVPTLYARLRDGKIWIENDWTSDGLASELMEQGVPAEDIVLAFHPPEVRVHTEFAVA